MKIHSSLVGFFEEELTILEAKVETKAYVIGVLNTYRQAEKYDLSKTSITLAYFDAVKSGKFESFQQIGDWVLFAETVYPESIVERTLILDLGRKSYGHCANILMGKWQVYADLETNLENICFNVRKILFNKPMIDKASTQS